MSYLRFAVIAAAVIIAFVAGILLLGRWLYP